MRWHFTAGGFVCRTVLLVMLASVIYSQTDPPPNDDFANPQTISGLVGSAEGTNVGGTTEADEPIPWWTMASVWYEWDAPQDACMNLWVEAGSADAAMGIYTGGSLAELSAVAIDDDSGVWVSPLVVFPATAGTRYRIQVLTWHSTCSFTLKWACVGSGPANDNFANAQIINGRVGTLTYSNLDATRECGENQIMADTTDGGSSSVWYRWTAPRSGRVMMNTIGSTYDTMLGVYIGDGVASLTTIAESDDYSLFYTDFPSRVVFTAVAGTEYKIRLDGWDNRSGYGVLNWGQVVGITSLRLGQKVAADSSSRFMFVLRGTVAVIDGNSFCLDDASGPTARVCRLSHGRTDGEWVRVEGMRIPDDGWFLGDVYSIAKLD